VRHTIHASASIGVAIAGPGPRGPRVAHPRWPTLPCIAQTGWRRALSISSTSSWSACCQPPERERELRQVLEKRLFEIWYQPIFRLQTGKLEGFESVLCWRRGRRLGGESQRKCYPCRETGSPSQPGPRRRWRRFASNCMNGNDVRPAPALPWPSHLTQRQFTPRFDCACEKDAAASGADPARLLLRLRRAL